MAFRRSFVVQNPFDEQLKFAGDEVDLCMRCREQNKKIYYVPRAIVTHYHRANYMGASLQHFRYGYSIMKINLKHKKFPFLNIGSILLLGAMIFLFFSFSFSGAQWGALFCLLLFLGLGCYFNARMGLRKLSEFLLTLPGFLFLYIIFCSGCVSYPFLSIKKK